MTDTSIDEPATGTLQVAEQATKVTSAAKEQAAVVAQSAAGELQNVSAKATQEAKDLFADARAQLQAQAAEQADRVAALLGDVGSQLRAMADAGQPGMARDVVEQIAAQVQQMGSRLGDGGLQRTLEDARRLGRNRPGAFLLGAAAAGVVAARIARNVDTRALADAAKPSDDSPDGAMTSPGANPDPVLDLAEPPSGTGAEVATAPVPMDGRP